MKLFLIGIVLFVFFGCSGDRPCIKIDVLSNYEFILNGKKHSIDQFPDVFREVKEDISDNGIDKFDIELKVHNKVEMNTILNIKVEFAKVKREIGEIRYSHESLVNI